MTTKQDQARELFFQTDLSQAHIAKLLKVNAKTVYRWIKQNEWERIKKAALNAPALITEKLYAHLNSMCIEIAGRTQGTVYPTLDESRTMLNLASTIKRLSSRPSLGDHCESITGFLDYVIRKDYDKGQIIAKEVDAYLLREAETNSWYEKSELQFHANNPKPVREDMSDVFEDGSELIDENSPLQAHPTEIDEITEAMAKGEPLTKREKKDIATRKWREGVVADIHANRADPATYTNSANYSGYNPKLDELEAIDESKLRIIDNPVPQPGEKKDEQELNTGKHLDPEQNVRTGTNADITGHEEKHL